MVHSLNRILARCMCLFKDSVVDLPDIRRDRPDLDLAAVFMFANNIS